MKIKTKLRLNTVISLGTVILILLSLVWSFREIIRADRDMELADEMRKVAFERILLRDEYLLYQEERAKAQWYAKSEALRDLLGQADTRLDQEEDKALLQDAMKYFEATFTGMSRVMEGHSRQDLGMHGMNTRAGFSNVELRQISQVFLKAYSLTDNINRLHESAHTKAINARNRGVFIVIFIVFGGIIAIIINSTIIDRTLTKRVAALGKGVEIIGAGDLDHRIEVVGDDELTALALASNEMAAKLKQLYTSVENLQKEMAERKQAEEALRESEKKYRLIADNADDWVYLVSPAGDLPYISPSCERLTGYSMAEFTAHPQLIEEIVYREDREAIARHFSTVREAYRSDYLEYRIITKNGEVRWVSHACSPVYSQEGQYAGRRGTSRNITERKRAEDALKKNNALLNEIGKIAKIGGWEFDVETHKQIWTDEVYRIHEVAMDYNPTVEEGINFYAPTSRPVIEQAVQRAVEKGEPYDVELDFITAKGRRLLVRAVGKAYQEQGKTIKVAGMFQDLTERKQMESRLESTIVELQRSNEELKQFAYIASHDLQEPLRMIASYLQLIERRYKGKLDKDADEFITFAVEGANRLQEMIIGLLAYSRVQTKGKPFEEVNSAGVLGYAIANLRLVIEESGALVTAGPLPVINADAGQLLQVFQNLITNAIKFRGKDAPHIQISAEQKRSEWLFSVKDNGVGIEPEYKDKVFDMFRRLHGREYPGVGIGLSLCRRIVERHKGRIWLESEAGQGTTFYFTIPI